MMIKGIKSVDFKLISTGHGSVNNLGPVVLKSDYLDKHTLVSNHSIPKLRGFSPFKKIQTEDGEKLVRRSVTEIDLSETPAYVSENCFKHHFFPEAKYVSHLATAQKVEQLLATYVGLVRGYMIPKSSLGRTSCLHLDSSIEQLCNGNFEQFSRSGDKVKTENVYGIEKSNSLFSRTTLGDTKYITYGSISIESLQFICLDDRFGLQQAQLSRRRVDNLIGNIEGFLRELDETLDPKVTYHDKYMRIGSVYREQTQAGLLLNDDAIKIIVNETIKRLEDFSFRQAQGYMVAQELTVDYNNSNQTLRIKDPKKIDLISEKLGEDFAVYYEGVNDE